MTRSSKAYPSRRSFIKMSLCKVFKKGASRKKEPRENHIRVDYKNKSGIKLQIAGSANNTAAGRTRKEKDTANEGSEDDAMFVRLKGE